MVLVKTLTSIIVVVVVVVYMYIYSNNNNNNKYNTASFPSGAHKRGHRHTWHSAETEASPTQIVILILQLIHHDMTDMISHYIVILIRYNKLVC